MAKNFEMGKYPYWLGTKKEVITAYENPTKSKEIG